MLVVTFSVLRTSTLLVWSAPQFGGNICIYLHDLWERGSLFCSFHALGSPSVWVPLLGSALHAGEDLEDQSHQLLVPHMVAPSTTTHPPLHILAADGGAS